MSERKNGGPAFPRPIGSYSSLGPGEYNHAQDGMTLRQYAAIKLRVPDSGTDWLDDMIRQSLLDAMAAKAMAALIASRNTESDHGEYDERTVAESACAMADAMLAAREL